MRNHRYPSILAVLLLSLFVFNSCQESQDIAPLEEADPFEAEALEAVELEIDAIESNLPEDARRRGGPWEYAVTILKCSTDENGESQLLYNTLGDGIRGYTVVTEESITATTKPGTLVFWFRGRGMKKLNAIEFDEESRALIGNNTAALIRNKLWVSYIPENVPNGTLLKYDIVYESRLNDDGPIRLDPKLEVPGQ